MNRAPAALRILLCTLAALRTVGYIMPKSFKGCPAGKGPKVEYATRSLGCSKCPSGRFNPHAASRKPCLVCPHGKLPTHGRDKCWKRKHWNDCAPGFYGPDWSRKPPCRPCPPGRWGAAGTKTKAECKLCRRGRYGTGASTTASCKAPCLERRMCGPGATNPYGGQLCKAGKFELDTAKPHKACSLVAPDEFRPAGGYGSAFSEQGACILDKAYGLLDVLFAWKGCGTFSTESDSPCFKNQLKTLELSVLECCDGAEHPVFGKAQKTCETSLGGWLEGIRMVRAHFHNAMQPKNVWRRTKSADQDIVMPVFRKGINLASEFYDRDPARWGLGVSGTSGNPDLTRMAGHMLHEAPNGRSLAKIFKSIEGEYCKIDHCSSSFKASEEKITNEQYAPSTLETAPPAPVPTPAPVSWREEPGRGKLSYEDLAALAAKRSKHLGERTAGDGGHLATAKAVSAAIAAGYDDDTINGNTANVGLPVKHEGTLQDWQAKPKVPSNLAAAAVAAGEAAVADDDDDDVSEGKKHHKSSVKFYKRKPHT